MNFKRLLLLFSLCAVAAGCSEDNNNTPEPAPQKLVRQIRITAGTSMTTVHDFIYDNKQRIIRHTIAGAGQQEDFSFRTIEYTHSINKTYVTINNDGKSEHYTIRRNSNGDVESVTSEDTGNKYAANYTYNDNGYLYQQPSKSAWSSYEYRMSGERCNMEQIIDYAAGGVGDDQKMIGTTSFEYGNILNKSNLDFTYFSLLLSNDYTCTPLPLKLFGWVGKRNYNLPKAVEVSQKDNHQSARYEYMTDTEGYITDITEVNSFWTPSLTFKYKISYYE